MSDDVDKSAAPKAAPKRPDKPPSEEFFRVFCHGGTLSVECQCGVLYFAGDGRDYDEGELERYRKRAGGNPGKCVETGGDYVSYLELAGRTYVADCPCNFARPYEDFIWAHRREIADYLKGRVTREFEEKDWERQAIMGTLTEKRAAEFRARTTTRFVSKEKDRRLPGGDFGAHVKARAVADAHRQILREEAAGNRQLIASNERVIAAMKGRGDDPIDS